MDHVDIVFQSFLGFSIDISPINHHACRMNLFNSFIMYTYIMMNVFVGIFKMYNRDANCYEFFVFYTNLRPDTVTLLISRNFLLDLSAYRSSYNLGPIISSRPSYWSSFQ